MRLEAPLQRPRPRADRIKAAAKTITPEGRGDEEVVGGMGRKKREPQKTMQQSTFIDGERQNERMTERGALPFP